MLSVYSEYFYVCKIVHKAKLNAIKLEQKQHFSVTCFKFQKNDNCTNLCAVGEMCMSLHDLCKVQLGNSEILKPLQKRVTEKSHWIQELCFDAKTNPRTFSVLRVMHISSIVFAGMEQSVHICSHLSNHCAKRADNIREQMEL